MHLFRLHLHSMGQCSAEGSLPHPPHTLHSHCTWCVLSALPAWHCPVGPLCVCVCQVVRVGGCQSPSCLQHPGTPADSCCASVPAALLYAFGSAWLVAWLVAWRLKQQAVHSGVDCVSGKRCLAKQALQSCCACTCLGTCTCLGRLFVCTVCMFV